MDDGWAVAEAPGPSDMHGWQYAFGLYKSNRMWGGSSIGRRWQRRLWRCTLVLEGSGSTGISDAGNPRVPASALAVSNMLSSKMTTSNPGLGHVWTVALTAMLLCILAIMLQRGGFPFDWCAEVLAPFLCSPSCLLGFSCDISISMKAVNATVKAAKAWVFPLSAIVLFGVYPAGLVAWMVLEGRAAQEATAAGRVSPKALGTVDGPCAKASA